VHLSAITLRGFKSFPEPVEIRLEPGVAVVVGPNGSGKSNVADAIVWAAGSLSPSELRAEKPDDVLFAGGGSRPASDFCEVELLFDNQDGEGPVDYSELSVARRLHRGGEGQYLLNRTGVRRIDLVELLADLGLGGGSHSIIGQGKVEEILASSPEKRRELIEEAAGLGRFKRRRHRAELKLARVAVQVERARDVEAEVRKRLRPLALQATAAERAERIAAELARLRARLAELDLEAADERRAEVEERRAAVLLARRRADERLQALLRERGAAEEELADAAGTREGSTAALYRLRGAGERLGLRRESAVQLLERLRDDLDRARAASGEPAGDERGLERAAREAAEGYATARREQAEALRRARGAQTTLALLEREASAAAEAQLEALLRERDGVEQRLEQTAARRELLHALRRGADRLTVRREAAGELQAAAEAALARAREAQTPGAAPEELQAAADEAAVAARSALLERDALAERARDARERLAALEHSLAEREGLPPAARALAEAGETLALSRVEVEPGREKTVAAALAWRASALVAPDAEAALALLDEARARGLGTLSVLVGDRARELVESMRVVSREELLRVGAPAVTAEGYGYDPARGELWFVGEAAEAVLLELQARRKALAAEAEQLERDAAGAAEAAQRATACAEEAEEAFAAVRHLLGARRADAAALERVREGTQRLDAVLAAAAAAAARLEPRLAGGERGGDPADELRRLAALEGDARRAAGGARERAAAVEQELAALGGPVAAVATPGDAEATRAEAARLAAELDRARKSAASAESRLREAEAPLAERRRHQPAATPGALVPLVAGAERLDAVLAAGLAVAERLDPPLRARVDAGAVRAAALGEELRRLGSEEAEARRAVSEAGERAAALEVELARIEGESDEARRRLEAAGASPAEGDDGAELAAKAERLERRLETLGRVNPFAQEEYEAEKERLTELSMQREDLERSLAELEKLRAELTETVESSFAATFAAVERNFAEVAATLFPGGEGRLRLTEAEEGDPESAAGAPRRGAGVEVELRPAGKRITRLSLLSGGEKALAAISFLFALFLARPCPFYLLDEVEAALDDTNIGRFVELLRRYADRAQFVVITHQKRTMEAADVLYGVTMGADGVSEIVSRRLPQEDRAALASA
jgi:chromosome segregation protein